MKAALMSAMNKGNLPESMRDRMVEMIGHQQDFPELMEILEDIRIRHARDTGDARWSHGTMHVTPDLFNGEYDQRLARRREAEDRRGGNSWYVRVKAVDEGRLTHSDTAIAHEMGHAVEQAIGEAGVLESLTALARAAGLPTPKPVMSNYNDGSPEVIRPGETAAQWAKLPKVKRFLTKNLSQYGAGNHMEAAGELWAVYSLDRENAPDWVRAYGDNAVRLMTK